MYIYRPIKPHRLFITIVLLSASLVSQASELKDAVRNLTPTLNVTIVPGTPDPAIKGCGREADRDQCKEEKKALKLKARKIFDENLRKSTFDASKSKKKESSGEEGVKVATNSADASSISVVAAALQSAGLLSGGPKALILFDQPDDVAFSKLGQIYAIMLRNLLGHFDAEVSIQKVSEYLPDEIEGYDVVFYIGSYFDNPIPAAFLQDVVSTEKTVVWFRYNIWQLAWNGDLGFSSRFGLAFNGLRGFDSPPSVDNPAPGFFNTVTYKGVELEKYFDFDVETSSVHADPDAGWMAIADPAKAEAILEVENSVTGEVIPYITRSGNFWYFADLPLSYIGPRDRYLALADILHEILGVDHEPSKYAMLRLEDVASLVNFSNMRSLIDYLSRRDIPYTITAVPFYRDPNGVYNGGDPLELPMAQSESMLNSLDYALTRGGKISLHGYTHQYADEQNPYSGITGDDFEFWHIPNNAVVAEDSVTWASGRIQMAYSALVASGYAPFTWTTPHYQASPNAYAAVNQFFDSRYERSIYYTAVTPLLNLDVNNPDRDFAAGQFFPYLIESDYYGARLYPENLGNIEYDIREIDPASFIDYSWEEVYLNAVYAEVIRDGVASFFFHPFWLEPELGVRGFNDFRRLVRGISDLGYQWITPDQL
ncbi:DUF2334 domain-containing protein [Biformimicrobium ophioploci]|uniref:DUF2334 domain-containing protein n=1 Tax=Biformimicrobium ophioploci TaxID=3036711 RepID=A0ABQ6LXD7_9GAMM|nr:DUF2334 domain-containing protein [Microbulbifer sp. NKW57]GMG86784.1 hypothetical protein MNKW57_11050 [Microbulbifer sp. NKW57]